MSGVRLIMMVMFGCLASLAQAQLNIDLSKASLDTETGNYCVVQKVCITNPPEALTSAGCAPAIPEGCECDVASGAGCDEGYSCSEKNCKCLLDGCECDPAANDADTFCDIDEVCKDDCSCGSPLADGCTCDESIGIGCEGELLCVGCKCQACEQSMTRGGQVLNPPLVFVIDTTKSVKPDKDSIFNLTMKVVSNIMKDNINIPRYQLVTFNDYGPDISKNVNVELDTGDVREFGRAAASIKFESFNGGRDSKERLTQGLLIALQNADPKSLVVVFTDNGTKNLNLEKPIIKLRDEKECEVYIVLTPVYEGKPNGKSLPVYNRLGTVFEIEKVDSETFLQQVEAYEENNCV